MNFLNKSGIEEWCDDHGSSARSGRVVKLVRQPRVVVTVRIPDSPLQLISMALTVSQLTIPEEGEVLFAFRDWGFWSDAYDDPGLTLLKGFRSLHHEERDLRESAGHLLGPAEHQECTILAMIPMLFQWDAAIVSDGGEFVLTIDHDHGLVFSCAHEDFASRVVNAMSDWKPTVDERTGGTP